MHFPINLRYSRKCERCGRRYPEKEINSVHCHDLSDREVEELKLRIEEEHISNVNLGYLFFYIFIVLIIGMIVLIVI